MKGIDLSGQRFGTLTVICRSDKRAPRGARTVPLWECRCDCGTLTYKATDKLKDSCVSMCEACAAKYATQRMRDKAGYTEGTQISKLRSKHSNVNNSSGARGVYFDRRSGKWRARLRFKGKLMDFGTFANIEDAINARKEAEKEYYEPFLK